MNAGKTYATKVFKPETWNEADKELWSIVREVPKLEGVWPYICAVLNVFISGSGTMIAGCVQSGDVWNKT